MATTESLFGQSSFPGLESFGQTDGQDQQQDFFGDSFQTLQTGSSGSISTDLIVEGARGLFGRAEEQAKARTIEFNAKQVEAKGKQAAISAIEQLNAIQARNIVAAFGSGVRLSGSVRAAQETLGRKASIVTSINDANTRIRAGALNREAKRIRAEAEYQQIVGGFKIVAGALIKYYSGGTV